MLTDPKNSLITPRVEANQKRSRWRGQSHVGLLFWIASLVVGSAVWLNLVFTAQTDQTAGSLRRAAWASGGRGDNRATGRDGGAIQLEVTANMDTCGFGNAIGGDAVASSCASKEAQISVHAKIKNETLAANIDGLFLTLAASSDFETWWLANDGILLPREQFALAPAVVTPRHRERLETLFRAEQLKAAEVVNPQVERVPSDRVAAVDLAPLVPPMFHGSGAIEINEAIALDTMFGLANESHCQLEDTGQCVGPGMPAACVGGDVCRNFNDPPNPDGCRSAAPTSGCDWVPALDCSAKNQDGRPVYADAAACPEHRNCRWMRSASCSLNLDEFLEAYRQLRQRYEPDHEVSTYACVGSPGFVYLSACVHAGMPNAKQLRTGCSSWKTRNLWSRQPCNDVRGPPFGECRALSIACGPTCRSGAGSDKTPWQTSDPDSPLNYCNRTSGFVRSDVMDEMKLIPLGWPALLFAIVYTMGLCSTFQMFMPGVGVRQGQRPTWDRMQLAIKGGRLDTFGTNREKLEHDHSRRQWHGEWGLSSAARSWKSRASGRTSVRPSEHQGDGKQTSWPDERELVSGSAADVELMTAASAGVDAPRVQMAADHSTADITAISLAPLGSFKGDYIDVEDEQAELMQQVETLTGMNLPSDWEPMEECNGQTTVSFSISASEGRNIILRNLIGKVAANLELKKRVWNDQSAPATPMQIIDGFADEGHRVGAYYLMRAVSVAFYVAMPPSTALKIANLWIKAMNSHKSAGNVDIFDEGKPMPNEWGLGENKKVNLFELLSPVERRRSEVQYIELFHSLFHSLNSFTLPIDFLFNRVLELPAIGKPTHEALLHKTRAMYEANGHNAPALLARLRSAPRLAEQEEPLKELLGASFLEELLGTMSLEEGSDSTQARKVLLDHLLPNVLCHLGSSTDATPTVRDLLVAKLLCEDASAQPNDEAADYESTARDRTGSEMGMVIEPSSTQAPAVEPLSSGTSYAGFVRAKRAQANALANINVFHPSGVTETVSKLRASKTRSAPAGTRSTKEAANSAGLTPIASGKLPGDTSTPPPVPSVANPLRAKYEDSIDFFHASFVTMAGPLLFGFVCETTPHEDGERGVPCNAAAFMQALKELSANRAEPLATDAYFSLVSSRAPILDSDTQALMQDAINPRYLAFDFCVEVVKTDFNPSGEAAIRAVYLARGRPDKWQQWTKGDHRRCVQRGVWVSRKPKDLKDNNEWWRERRTIGLVEAIDEPTLIGNGKTARVFWYTSPEEDQSVAADRREEGSSEEPLKSLEVLNLHLGKAGGLNFGLEALLRLGITAPSTTFPMFFGIIDARHSCDSRFWEHVLPAFYLLNGDADERISFDPEICLVQLPHSYIGTKADTDPLDIRNDFLFSGMAVIRDSSYGMTSCGTGGIWAITSSSATDAGRYFYGRTMIEDTSTSHQKFLQGKRSVFLPPKRGTDDQLMRAVPKVSANYLEALERWDTGAVQILLSMSIWHSRFWLTLLAMLAVCTAVIAPMYVYYQFGELYYIWTGQEDQVAPVVGNVLGNRYIIDTIILCFSVIVFLTVFGIPTVLSWCFKDSFGARMLNYYLRFLIILFNSVYPLNALATIYWLSLPPFLCFTGEFPFSLEVWTAVFGSLVLMLVQFAMVAKMKADSEVLGSELDEISIFRSQQLDLVTVPIKLRAIVKGVSTALKDLIGKEDNSWWESFGAGHSKAWVQTWLLLVFSTMTVAVIVGTVKMIIAAVTEVGFEDMVLPTSFGMGQALINMWVLWGPMRYLMQDSKERPKPVLRYVNLCLIFVVALTVLVVQSEASSLVPT